MEDETYGVTVLISSEVPAKYAEHKKEQARHAAALKLFDILYQPGQPICTVRILDEEREGPAMGRSYRVWFEISPVRMRHVEIPMLPSYISMSRYDLSLSAVGEIKRRIKRQFWKLLKRN